MSVSSAARATRVPSQPRTAGARSVGQLRARLSIAPRRRVRAPKVPFVTLVSAILVGGVVGLLCFNTQMQQASFTASTLEERADNLGARQQTLEKDLEGLRNPNRVAAAAQRAGLVIPVSPAQISLATGKVTGSSEPATDVATPRLQGRAPTKPAVLAPPTQTVVVPAPPVDPAAAAAAAAAADAALAAQVAQQQAQQAQADGTGTGNGNQNGNGNGNGNGNRSAGRR
jgi:hypothetical protein